VIIFFYKMFVIVPIAHSLICNRCRLLA